MRCVPPGDTYKQWVHRRLAPDSTCFPDRRSRSVLRLATQSNTKWCCYNRSCFAWFGYAWSTRLWWYLKDRLAGVPWVVAQNISLDLWHEIGVKHVAFLELWLEMASLELWLEMVDEHKELLSCGSGWRVLPIWVCVWCRVQIGPVRLPSSVLSWWVW